MKQFRQDNTEGYSDSDLDELNALFDAATADLDPDDYDYHEICQGISEGILRDFDSEPLTAVSQYAEDAADATMNSAEAYGVADGFETEDEYVNFEMEGDAGDQCFVHRNFDADEMRSALRAAYNARLGEFFR